MSVDRRSFLLGLASIPLAGGAVGAATSTLAPPASAAGPAGGAAPSAVGGARPAPRQAPVPGEAPEEFPAPSRTINLYAVDLTEGDEPVRLGYGLTPESASFPGPTIEMLEGEAIAITLHNQISEDTLAELRTEEDLPLGISIHTHGLRYGPDSDGTVHSGSWVPPGESRTYTWYARPADPDRGIPGTAGYWWYHDHAVGTHHGTAGVNSGLFGALIVRRRDDPLPDHTFVTAFGDTHTINLLRYPEVDAFDPDNPSSGLNSIAARVGERVEFVCIALGTEMHTWHLHGHAWADTRTGTIGDVPWAEAIPTIDNKTIGPGDSFGFQVIAGDMAGPGTWMLHCHMQQHSDMGMATNFHVLDEQGQPVDPHH